jgi:Phage tail assembly chaperone protein
MIIRIRSTGAVMYEGEFRQYVKNTTGGTFDALTPQIIASHDADPVLEGAQPVCGRYQVSVRNGVEQINDEWHTKYIAVDLSDEQKATKDADQAKFVRDDRNKRLADCDWTQLTDAPVDKTVWAVYRQSLRDITKQDGFPWTVSWPTTP